MQKTTRLQRLLAVIVAVFMAVCCLPLNAFAAGGVAITVNFMEDGKTEPIKSVTTSSNAFGVGKEYSYKGYLDQFLPTDAIPDGYELVNEDVKVLVPESGIVEVEVQKIGGDEPEEPATPTTSKAHFVFIDETGKTVGELDSTHEYKIGVSYDVEQILPKLEGYTIDSYFESFAVKSAEDNTVTVPVHLTVTEEPDQPTEPAEPTTSKAHFVFIDETGKTVGEWDSTYEYKIGVAYDIEQIIPKLNGYTIDSSFTSFTVKGAEDNTVAVPVHQTVTEEPSEPEEKVSTYVTFNFVDANGEFLNATKSSHPYYVGETYAASFVIPMLKGFETIDPDFEFTVASKDAKVVVPVKEIGEGETEKVSTYVTFNFVDANGEFLNATKSSYPYYVGETYGADFVIPMLKGFETIDPDFEFTVASKDAKVVVPVKEIGEGETEKVSTYVTFNFYDENGEFLNATKSTYPYYVGATYGADFILPMLKGYEVVDPDFTFTVDCENAKVKVAVKTEDYNVTIKRSNGADDVVVPIVKGTNLLAALNTDEVMGKVKCDGYKVSGFTYEDGSEIADEDVVTGDVTVRANMAATSSSSSSDNNNNTTTVSSNNNKTTTASNTQVVKSAAPADNTAKVMPQTGLTAETPVVFGVMMVAALAGAGAYLFAIRKKLN